MKIVTIGTDELETLIKTAVKTALSEVATNRPEPQKANEFLHAKDIAKLFSLSIGTINRYARDGGLPTVKVGGKRLFNKAEVLVAMAKKYQSKFR